MQLLGLATHVNYYMSHTTLSEHRSALLTATVKVELFVAEDLSFSTFFFSFATASLGFAYPWHLVVLDKIRGVAVRVIPHHLATCCNMYVY